MKKVLSVISVIVFVLCMGNTGFAMETESTQDINVYDDDEMIDEEDTSLNQTVTNGGGDSNGGNNIEYDLESIDMSDAIEIRTPRDLYNIRNDLSGKYKLMNDIDLTEVTSLGGLYDFQGRGWKPIGSANDYSSTPFTGVLDGQGYSISGLRIDAVGGFSGCTDLYMGLFAQNEGVIRNLNISKFNIKVRSGNTYCGCLAGNTSGYISNVYVWNSTVNVEIGLSWDNKISRYEYRNNGYVGGVAGENKGIISDSSAECIIDVTGNGGHIGSSSDICYTYIYAGGISANNSENSKIMRSYSDCSFSKTNNQDKTFSYHTSFLYSSGISGGEYGLVQDSYSVSIGSDYGISKGGTINNCYHINSGRVQYPGTATNCYYMLNKGTAGTGWIALNDLQMKEASFFEGFDFENVWYISDRTVYKYPQLQSVKKGITKIEIVSEPTNEIVVGTELKYEGAVARIYRDDDSTEDVILTPDNTTGGDTSSAGKKTVTFTYKGISASFEIDVLAVAVKELEIKTMPTKVIYKEGEAFDPTGMVVNAIYNNGDIEECTDYTVGDITGTGNVALEISKGDIKTTVNITVNHELTKTEANAATCTEKGNNAYYKCSVCNKYFSDENAETEIEENSWIINEKGHKWGEWQVTTPASIASAGERTRECENCDATDTETIDKLNEDDVGIKELVVETMPTKTVYIEGEAFDATGMVVKKIYNNDEEAICTDYTVGEIEGTGTVSVDISKGNVKTTINITVNHNLSETAANAETCTENGNNKYYKCSVCNKYFSDENAETEIAENSWIIVAHGHSESAAVKENVEKESCEKAGSYDEVVYCSECGTEITRKEVTVKKLGHSWSAWKETKTATTTQDGEKKRTCSRCGKTETKVIPKLQSNTGTITTTGIYCASNYPSIKAGMNVQKSNPNDVVEYKWVACDNSNPGKWFEISPWTKNNNWMNWTPDKSGGYVFVCYARIVGNNASQIESSFGTEYHKHISGVCQMPYTGEGGGYLIGIESRDNPNNKYKFEILILDCNLYLQGKNAWVYTSGKCGAQGNSMWTLWQPQYGYYWTLFRIYDENDNLIDEACYGFANIF